MFLLLSAKRKILGDYKDLEYLLNTLCHIDPHRAANLCQSLWKIPCISTIPLSVDKKPIIEVHSAVKGIASHLLGPISTPRVICILKNKIRFEITSTEQVIFLVIHALTVFWSDDSNAQRRVHSLSPITKLIPLGRSLQRGFNKIWSRQLVREEWLTLWTRGNQESFFNYLNLGGKNCRLLWVK